MANCHFTKMQKQLNAERTVFSANGAEKIGH